MFGIQDPGVLSAYFLAFTGAVICAGYGILNWNRGDEPIKQEDVQWAKEEQEEVENSL